MTNQSKEVRHALTICGRNSSFNISEMEVFTMEHDDNSSMSLREMVNTPGGKIMLLQLAIEEMQDGIGRLGGNQTFIEAVINALWDAGVLTAEQLEKRSSAINEKIARCESPFDRPFIFVDQNAPAGRQVTFWPDPAIKRAMEAMKEGEFIPPRYIQ